MRSNTSLFLVLVCTMSASAPAEPATGVDPATSAAPAPAGSDPTLIVVPSNTLGPGVPLWVRREQAEADARIARAQASYAEARAALARIEAQAAADRPDLFPFGGAAGTCGRIVVYGPHQPGLARAIANRPVPRPVNQPHGAPATRAGINAGFEDQHSAAQRNFAEAARPRIEADAGARQQAQRRFAEIARPPVVPLQQQRDDAQLRIRRVPKTSE